MARVLADLQEVAAVAVEELSREPVTEAMGRLVDAEAIERLADDAPDVAWRQPVVLAAAMPAWEERAVRDTGGLEVVPEGLDGLRVEIHRFPVVPPLPLHVCDLGNKIEVRDVEAAHLDLPEPLECEQADERPEPGVGAGVGKAA